MLSVSEFSNFFSLFFPRILGPSLNIEGKERILEVFVSASCVMPGCGRALYNSQGSVQILMENSSSCYHFTGDPYESLICTLSLMESSLCPRSQLRHRKPLTHCTTKELILSDCCAFTEETSSPQPDKDQKSL